MIPSAERQSNPTADAHPRPGYARPSPPNSRPSPHRRPHPPTHLAAAGLFIVAALAACDNGASPSPDSTPHVTATAAKPAQSATSSAPTPTATATAEAAPEALRPRYGTVMIEIGQRFETIGRAALANRWELAAFEADEMDELLDEDLRNAEPPKKGPTRALAGMADSFRGMHVAALKRAVKARDKKAFNEAFTAAAAACNGCHDSSSHRFIEIASAPGKPVLVLDPLPATK